MEESSTIEQVYRGTFVHSTPQTPLLILEDALLGVNTHGKIAFIGEGKHVKRLSQDFKFSLSDVKQMAQHEFFMPGMVDTHIHAPQYSYAGTALDLPLLQWLNKYTFPVEARFEDLKFAQQIYNQVVKRTLRNGTTTACYFATIHTDASLLLGQIANDLGQRALVGKVCMDRNDSAKTYKETSQESQEETLRFIKELLEKKYPRVSPVVTPRFALYCTEPLLGQLGAIAKYNNIHIQSHIGETVDRMNVVKELFPDSKSYTDVYNKHNLLTDKTVMAHGCYLSDEELTLFRQTGASLAHSNKAMLYVAGGYSASMLDAVRRALETSKVLTIQNPGYKTLTFEEVFRLATLGGSQALSLDKQTGNFEVGKDFDALRVNVAAPGGPIDLIKDEHPKILLEKFLNLGDDRNIVEVFVAGKKVVPFTEKTQE
uniref:Guanine deaminase-like n=1 Tax=Gouania willdenowi TaxID=441366 RepID=A0A8C5GFL3_GOUWI